MGAKAQGKDGQGGTSKRRAEPARDWTEVGFEDISMALAASGRGLCLLTGWEDGPAGAANPAHPTDSAANSMSFCVDGTTYTAFEDPDDGYRSCLGRMRARPGNHCSTRFEPVALQARFDSAAPGAPEGFEASQLTLAHPGTGEAALTVGTDHSDDYYPCFVAHMDPEVLQRARDMGIALAWALDGELPAGAPAARRPRL